MDLLKGHQFLFNDGRKITFDQALKAKMLLLYFSGIWCPPCITQFFPLPHGKQHKQSVGKGFLPAIKNFYREVNKSCTDETKNVEIIFVSCDTSKEEYDDHLSELPFPGIPFGDPLIEDLEEIFDVENIPVVPLIRKNGSIACENVRRIITEKGSEGYSDLAKLNVIW